MPKIRLLIASQHPIVRTGLGTLLSGVRDFEVVGEVDLSHLAKAAREFSPDVFLVELTEAGLPGLQSIAALMRAASSAAVAFLVQTKTRATCGQCLHWVSGLTL